MSGAAPIMFGPVRLMGFVSRNRRGGNALARVNFVVGPVLLDAFIDDRGAVSFPASLRDDDLKIAAAAEVRRVILAEMAARFALRDAQEPEDLAERRKRDAEMRRRYEAMREAALARAAREGSL